MTPNLTTPSKIYLNVSYAQKNDAKQYGARWDAAVKRWYFLGETVPEGLQQYLPQTIQVTGADNITRTREYTRCRKCGETGRTGAYPFSTMGAGICDDCV